jgi:glutaredoxin
MTVTIDCSVEFNMEGIWAVVDIGGEYYWDPSVTLVDLCKKTVGFYSFESGELSPDGDIQVEWMREQLVDAIAYLDSIEKLKYIVYGTPVCGYCIQTKKLLEQQGIPFDYKDLGDVSSDEKDMLMKIAGKEFRTVPQIFKERKDGLQYVGGFTELKEELK